MASLRINLSLILAIVLVAVAVVQLIRPTGSWRVHPVLLTIAALLLLARYAAVRQARKREDMLKTVPKHPLGLMKDDDD